jgi:DNA-binding transcriptional regulator YiaG
VAPEGQHDQGSQDQDSHPQDGFGGVRDGVHGVALFSDQGGRGNADISERPGCVNRTDFAHKIKLPVAILAFLLGPALLDRIVELPSASQTKGASPMPNIATVLKAEIARLAKKEAKVATSQLRKASSQYRSDIAKLKRLLGQQAKEMIALRKQHHGQPQTDQQPDEKARFSARSVRAQRKRLGLSALGFGKLVGVSGLTIYSWESGKSRPRKAQLAGFMAVRGIGKREAMAKLEEIEAGAKKKGRKAR